VKSFGGSTELLRVEENRTRPAVRIHPATKSAAGVIGEPSGFAARRRNYEDVQVAVVVGVNAIHFPSGEKKRIALRSHAGCQALRITTLAADRPDVAAIAECNFVRG